MSYLYKNSFGFNALQIIAGVNTPLVIVPDRRMSAHLTAVASVPANRYVELIGLAASRRKERAFWRCQPDDGTAIVALAVAIGSVKLAL